jgi:hypothetical protein
MQALIIVLGDLKGNQKADGVINEGLGSLGGGLDGLKKGF